MSSNQTHSHRSFQKIIATMIEVSYPSPSNLCTLDSKSLPPLDFLLLNIETNV
jgi:hypothetical protein